MNRFKTIVITSIIALLLSGCWDTINIEDRGFIAGAAIDLVEDHSDNPTYSITNQFVLPVGYAANPSQGGSDQKVFRNITSKGKAVYRVNDEMAALTSKTPYYGHMKILIISEDLAKETGDLSKLLDFYLRSVDIRRGVMIAVAEGKAKKILDMEQPENELPAINIRKLLEQSSNKTGFFEPLVIGDIEELYMRKQSFVLPYLQADKQVKRTDGAVFHGPDQKMVGVMSSHELQGMEIFSGKAIQNIIDFKYEDFVYGMEIVRLRRKVTIDPSNPDRIKVRNALTVEGVIKEADKDENFLDKKKLKKIENAASKEIEKSIHNAVDLAQNEFNTDIFKVWQVMETKHYDAWKKMEDNWERGENYFSKADFDIEVDTKIYSTGTTNKTN